MSLFEPENFESFTMSLPGVSLVDQWESRVAKVGGKVFTLLRLTSPDLHSIVFKCPEESYIVLTGIEGIKQARPTSRSGSGCAFRRKPVSTMAKSRPICIGPTGLSRWALRRKSDRNWVFRSNKPRSSISFAHARGDGSAALSRSSRFQHGFSTLSALSSLTRPGMTNWIGGSADLQCRLLVGPQCPPERTSVCTGRRSA